MENESYNNLIIIKIDSLNVKYKFKEDSTIYYWNIMDTNKIKINP